ncbi:MAG TPA: hypothetical protein VMN60_12295 [Longimicrobiales bacterium]|nr:hypothetical protein [Longimicrobiales bacterium]
MSGFIPQPGELEKLRTEWERHRTPGHAADLVDAALLIGRPGIATDAAAFLFEANRNPISRSIATAVLYPSAPNGSEPRELSLDQRYGRIAEAKRALRLYPRDPIRMVDLAREYSILGQEEQAKAMLRQALILAPNDRFVVRSASRFFYTRTILNKRIVSSCGLCKRKTICGF